MKIINNNWEFTSRWSEDFLQGGEAEETVRIPHTVKMLPLHEIDSQSYQMRAGYRRHLSFNESQRGNRYFLQFDAAAHIATLYFNGRECLTHRNGYTAFRYEITDLIAFGSDNVITVKLDTTENPSIPPFGFVIDYLTYGGIYRNVYLDERPQNYIEDVFITTPDLHTADIALTLDHESDEKVTVEISKSGIVKAFDTVEGKNGHIQLKVKDAQPWSPDDPQLYTCRVKYGEDEQIYHFGFRTIEINENAILLNDREFFVRGLNRHQCFPYIGYAASDSLQVEDARILKEELHVNAVRTSHYPQSHAFLDACDQMGLLVFTEIPGWQHIGNEAWKQQAVENTKEMVRQYRNHVSIFLWGVRINESLDDDAMYEKTNAAAHELDPSRPTSGVRYLEKSSLLEDVYAFNDFSHMGNNPGCRQKKDVMKDTHHPLLISEANGHMFPTKPWDRWERLQEHALRHARVLNDAMADHEHAGVFPWCMFDYPTHRQFGSGDRICYHGVMDSFRNPKPAAFIYASQGEEEPVLEISSPMDIGDYNATNLAEFYAFTNADEVRLYKNNEFVKSFKVDERFHAMRHGPVKIDDTIGDLLKIKEGFTGRKEEYIHDALCSAQKYGLAGLPLKAKLELGWVMMHYHLKYEEGVELYGKYVGSWGGDSTTWRFEAVDHGKVVKTVIKTPNTDLHLEVKTSNTELKEGDAYDMSSFRLCLKDANDNRAVYAQLPVKISVEGPIEIVGPDAVALEGGMSGTYIRTTGSAGEASITFTTAQTQPVTVKLHVTMRDAS